MNFLPQNLFLALVLGVRLLWPSASDICYLAIAAYALFGYSHAIKALSASWLLTMINPALSVEIGSSAAGRYLVIVSAFLSVMVRLCSKGNAWKISRLSAITWLVGILIVGHSAFLSEMPDVSVLKITSWMLVVSAMLSAWRALSLEQRDLLFFDLQNGLTVVMLASIPLIFFPAVGFAINQTGFQGLLNHPQAFGPTIALLGALVGGRMLAARVPSWIDILQFSLCLILIMLSESRTAGLAMILGLFAAIILIPWFSGSSAKKLMPGLRSGKVLLLLGAFIIGSVFYATSLSDYLFKRSGSIDFASAAQESRGALVEDMMANIEARPFSGIGFGIASQPAEMKVERDSYFGLPVSALVEKGVMPIAIVEELGIFGALIVVFWILLFLRQSALNGLGSFAVIVTLLLVNLGESMLFSTGGMGLLLLIFFTGSAIKRPNYLGK